MINVYFGFVLLLLLQIFLTYTRKTLKENIEVNISLFSPKY